MDQELVNLDEIWKMLKHREGTSTIEVAEVEYQTLLEDASHEGLIVIETENSFSMQKAGKLVTIQRGE